MKKRTPKPKAKLAADKNGAVQSERIGRASPAVTQTADPHDPLYTLLRDTFAQRACERTVAFR